MNFEELWVEKYRPTHLNDLLLTPDVREFFENITKEEVKAIPHLLFVGPRGGGKTSLAKIVVNDIMKCEYLYINASDENGIDVVRNKLTNYIQTKSFDGGMKVIILDEADGLSSVGGGGSSAQQALRNIMEEYNKYSRFILTANYNYKIMEAIDSRCITWYIQPELNPFIKRCLTILKAENITVTKESTPELMTLIKSHYPDLRKAIGALQQFSISGAFKASENITAEIASIATTCFDMLVTKKDMFSLRKVIIENEHKFKSNYNLLFRNLFEQFYQANIDITKKRNILLIIAEAMKDDTVVLDKEVNFFATCIKIDNVI